MRRKNDHSQISHRESHREISQNPSIIYIFDDRGKQQQPFAISAETISRKVVFSTCSKHVYTLVFISAAKAGSLSFRVFSSLARLLFY